MKKGLTPIISVVLLLMMTVAAFGIAYLWLKTFQEDVQKEMEKSAKSNIYKTKKSFEIIGVYEDTLSNHNTGVKIILRNTGESTFKMNELQNALIVVDGKYQFSPLTSSITSDLPPGSTITLEVDEDMFGGTQIDLADQKVHKIKVYIGKWESSVICGPLESTDTACVI